MTDKYSADPQRLEPVGNYVGITASSGTGVRMQTKSFPPWGDGWRASYGQPDPEKASTDGLLHDGNDRHWIIVP
jgi:hypothetical protein